MNAPFSNLAPDGLQAVAFTLAVRLVTVRLPRIILKAAAQSGARAVRRHGVARGLVKPLGAARYKLTAVGHRAGGRFRLAKCAAIADRASFLER
jgi:hypothetical protein